MRAASSVRIVVAAALLLLVPLASAVASECGDVTGDRLVTDADALLILDAAAGLAGLCPFAACDLDGSGTITDTDAVNAFRLAAGLSAERACPPAAPLEVLAEKLETLRWIAYAPSGFDPSLGCPAGFPSEASMRLDLQTLAAHGFQGVITFAADCVLGAVPRIAREVGFDGVIMGLFMFDEALRREEVTNAIAAAPDVDGYGIGNEGLIGCGGALYDATTLIATLDEVAAATGKPVTTSEQIEDYLGGGCLHGFLLDHGDWVFPIAHPFNNGIRSPEAGAAFVTDRFAALRELTTRPVFFKETGWPTAGDPAATERQQAAFFAALEDSNARYAYFEAFDQPWKTSLPLVWEPFWGVFGADRTPKELTSSAAP